jgi:hypothetical protein
MAWSSWDGLLQLALDLGRLLVCLLPELGLEERDEPLGMLQSLLGMLKGLALPLDRGIEARGQG